MTRAQALALATKHWGKSAAVEDGGKRFRDGTLRPTPEEREVFEQELREHPSKKPAELRIEDFGDERTVGEWRKAAAQRNKEYREWKDRRDRLFSLTTARRYSVGTVSFAFFIRGQGDSWEEAFRKAGIQI